jgi:putative copper export protein
MAAEPLIQWPEPLVELLEFVGVFLAAGAVGFRYVVLRGHLAPGAAGGGKVFGNVPAEAARRAAGIGLVGAVLVALRLGLALPELAARNHVGIAEVVTGTPVVALWAGLTLAALAGFALARGGVPALQRLGWGVAAIGVVAGTLRNGLVGQWARLVNPLHLLVGGLWIGTLFVLVAAGLPVVRRGTKGERAGVLVAELVNAFSPLALVSAAALVLFGVITAWQHLKSLSALWTTPYGYALLAKLCVVAVVFLLGAWNWRRQRPLLGSAAASASIQRSATAELIVAAIVLIITSILVSLPTPKPPGS